MPQTPEQQTTDPQPEPRPQSRTRLIAAAVVVFVVIGLVVFGFTRGGGAAPDPVAQSASPVVASLDASPASPLMPASPSTTAPPSTTAAASPSPTTPAANPALAECTQVTEGFVPNRFTIESLGADEKVIALNLDKDGNIAAPPFDQPRTASWWSGGPKPGSGKGKAVMSIHTYNPSLPPALGNEMYEGGKPQLKKGDLIKLYGKNGQVMCYEYTDAKKIWVNEYDPNSDVMVDFEGDPELAIVICWDFDKSTRDWDSRILFYADPVKVAA